MPFDSEIKHSEELSEYIPGIDNKDHGYDTGVRILEAIGWKPEVIPPLETPSNHITRGMRWDKVDWTYYVPEQEDKKDKDIGIEKGILMVRPMVVEHNDYAMGITEVTWEEEKPTYYGQMVGIKIKQKPKLLMATQLGESIRLLKKYVKEYMGQKLQPGGKYRIFIYSEYFTHMKETDKSCRKIYGKPKNNYIPEQEAINLIIRDLLQEERLVEIRFLTLCKVGKRIAAEIGQETKMHQIELIKAIKQDLANVPVFWLEQEEIKELLKQRQETHERETLQLLLQKETFPSISSQIFFDWELTRQKVKEILRFLEKDRKLQVTFTNLIGATRFKTTEKGKLYVTICPKCEKETDNWQHHKKCYNLSVPYRENGGKKQESAVRSH